MHRRAALRAGAGGAWALRAATGGTLAAAFAARSQQPAPPFTEADIAHAEALRDAARGDRLAWQLVESLCTEVGARPAGSAADARAVDWAQRQARRLGFANVHAEPFATRAWQRGPASVAVVAGSSPPERLVALAIGGSPATPEGGIEAEVAAYPDLDALIADPAERARGRIAFIDNPRMQRSRDGRGYGFAVRARFAGPAEAGKRGALALVIRSAGTSAERVAHTGTLAFDTRDAAVPALALANADADRLAALLRSSGAAPLRLRVDVQATRDIDATSHNVIAEVPGGELANEVVLLGAHLDSWDVGQGAQDDAAGVGIVLAAAKRVLDAGRKPRRTLRIVLFGAEEMTFDGARAYGARYRDVPHQLVAESDFGAGRPWRLKSRVRDEALPAIDALARVLAPLAIAHDGNDGVPGPDAALLMRRHRWPAIALTQDGTAYFDVHHTENDTLERVDREALEANVAAWAPTIWLAAQSTVAF